MTRTELERYIDEHYHEKPDYPWMRDPDSAVFRHSDNRKWFALVMNVPKTRLGLKQSGTVDIVNLKCEAIVTGSFWQEPGIFPAYHMNKEHWLTAALDGTAADELIEMLLDMSFQATKAKPKATKN